MQKRVASSRWQSFGVMCVCVLRQFSVFPRIHTPIFPDKLQKITKCFQCGYKTETKLKYITHYAIFQNRRICASCQLYGLFIMRLVHFAIYARLAFCACGYSHQAVCVVLVCMSS